MRPFTGTWYGAAIALMMALVAWGPFRRMGTLEGQAWDLWLWLPSLVVLAAAIGALFTFAAGWRRLRSVLDLYACTRLRFAFGRVPYHASRQPGGVLLVREPDVHGLAPLVTRLLWLAGKKPHLQGAAEEAERRFKRETEGDGPLSHHGTRSETYRALMEAAVLLRDDLDAIWSAAPTPPGTEEPADTADKDATAWAHAAEDFVAALIVCRIFHALERLRHALTITTGGLLLLLAAMMSYPFEHQSSILRVVAAAELVTVGVALALFVQMERDEVLSRILRTNPGEINWSSPLLLKVVLFAVVPLSGVAAASFPAIGRGLFGWVVPLLRLMQ